VREPGLRRPFADRVLAAEPVFAAPPPTERPFVPKAVAAAPVTPVPTAVPDDTPRPYAQLDGTATDAPPDDASPAP